MPIINIKILRWKILVTTLHNNWFSFQVKNCVQGFDTPKQTEPPAVLRHVANEYFVLPGKQLSFSVCIMEVSCIVVFLLAWGDCSFQSSPKGMDQISEAVKMRLKLVLLGKWQCSGDFPNSGNWVVRWHHAAFWSQT